jgi:hypothetical protein
VLDGDDIVYVALVPSARLAAVKINIGTRFEAYATSMGRVLLAGLPEAELDRYLDRLHLTARTERSVRTVEQLRHEIDKVRERGWALVDSELEEGLRGRERVRARRAHHARARGARPRAGDPAHGSAHRGRPGRHRPPLIDADPALPSDRPHGGERLRRLLERELGLKDAVGCDIGALED